MPKERRSRSVSFDRPSPFHPRSSNHPRNSPLPSSSRNPPRSPRPAANDVKEWDEIRCPVCMDHPHNAVLLHCASHEKGCRPFMCDTSYRHSNCLDQYRKAVVDASMEETTLEASKPRLSCPLCRGIVSGWKVVEAARKHMNAKPRSCSTESCGFTGAYSEIRRHARTEHPLVRPSDTDPDRQRDWRRLEQQRDLGDLFSTMQSVLGGEDPDGLTILADGGEFGGLLPLPSITLFLVLRFRGPGGLSSSTGWSSARRGSLRSSRSRRGRGRVLWGESIVEPEPAIRARSDADDTTFDGYDYDDDDDDYNNDDNENDRHDDDNDDDGDGGEAIASSLRRRRTRRRLTIMEEEEEDEDGDDRIV